MKKQHLKTRFLRKHFPFYLVIPLVLLLSNNLSAQCEAGFNVPEYFIDMAAAPNGNVIGNYALEDPCCASQGNVSCMVFDINIGTTFSAVGFCIGTPCAITGEPVLGMVMPGDGSLCPVSTMPIDLCNEQVCAPPGETQFKLLVCKPGAANSIIDISTVGIEPVNLDLNGTVVENCTAQFQVSGAATVECVSATEPPVLNNLPVTWSSVEDPTLAFLSCTTCANPIFAPTGAGVTDCAGASYSYTVSTPATDCSPAMNVTETTTVYPPTTGSINTVCTGLDADLQFIADVSCPELIYQWTDNLGNPILGETASSLNIAPFDLSLIHI